MNRNKDKKKIILAGYFGFDNLGDETLLRINMWMLNNFFPNQEIIILSNKPDCMKKIYGVECVNRYSLFKIMKKLKKDGVLLVGGGTLIQDSSSRHSLWYYLSLIKLAQLKGLKVAMISSGINPMDHKSSTFLSQKILSKVDVIVTRDIASQKRLQQMNIKNVTLASDLFFFLPKMTLGRMPVTDVELHKNKRYVLITVRPDSSKNSNFYMSMVDLCNYIAKSYQMIPLFLPMQYQEDMPVIQKIVSHLSIEYYIIEHCSTVEELDYLYDYIELVIGMRLHSLIFATLKKKKMVGIAGAQKIADYCNEIDVPCFLLMNPLEEWKSVVDEIISSKPQQTNKILDDMQKRVEKNITELSTILSIKSHSKEI